MPHIIGVIGVGEASAREAELAEALGRRIAAAGHTLVCGGRGGVMAASAKGAFEAGGLTVGILPGRTRDEANPFLRVALATGLGEARNAVIATASDALVAVGTGWGTVSEIALGLKLGKPVVLLGGAAPFLAKRSLRIREAETPEAALRLLVDALAEDAERAR